ncbi:MAG TPA: dihydrolipoyl dehydrogenase [Actinomycetota bacterium]|jgi:dihydrolipoamide dehydrogenase|nr:dihydrolipoyl dehydrogenase [Actinomycetota bacterium]
MADAYDVVVIGSGTGGYSCALRSAELGKRVALVERDGRLGGTCLLRGCIPTKALLRSAEILDTVNRAEEWGVKASGSADWDAVKAFEDRMVDKLVSGLTSLIKARKVDVVQGTAVLRSGTSVSVDGKEVSAADVVIATGSSPKLLPGVSITDRIITSDQALTYPSIPTSAVVIGAGAVGLEFASLYRSLGAEVTVLEALPRIAPLEDEDISKELGRAFRKRGIQAFAGTRVQSIDAVGDAVKVVYEVAGASKTVTADVCLVAVGRGPVTEGLGAEQAGVELDRGFVKVEGQLHTTAPHVWAVGDVAATPLQLAHVAFTEGIAVAERIAGIEVPEIDYAGIPRVTYCTPEVASVGLTEAQAVERGHEVQVEKLNFQAVGKANIVGEGGIVKVIADKGGGPVVGIHMVGPHVTDLIAEAMLITNWEAVPAEVAALIHPHPTLSEAIGEAHLALAGKPLHTA